MARPSYGLQAQKQARCLLEALLTYANDEIEDCDRLKIEVDWQPKNQLVVRTTVRHLEFLVNRVFKDYKLTSEQIKEALGRYQDFLTILEDHRTKTRGSDNWHFTLKLWVGRHEKAANLQRFDEDWERRRPERSRQVAEGSTEVQREVEPSGEASEIDRLVQLIREKGSDSIQARCGYMRVLDMAQPVGLEAIYTTVNIYESISGRQRRALMDFLQQLSSIHPGSIQKSQVSALEAVERYSKLIIFGKPGTGKTTFLKWLAIQCSREHLWVNLIPVFLSAKAFAEAKGQPELLHYIHKQWSDGEVLLTQTESILQRGRALILLDGLDEVRETDYDRVLQEIQEFSTQFHKCLFVITCRIAAQEYTFEQFTEVEIADFDDQQVTTFATQWFESRNDPAKTARFLDKLRHHQRIQDLTTNPLLLTLLCLVFQESADFPSNRSDLYQEGLEILLKNWDAKRHIERDGLYRKLSMQCKEALLSEIAFTTFERGEYFFKRQVVEQYIADFLHTLPTLNDTLDPLEIDSEVILKSIEAQHGLLVERAKGVYSFSHLTFHEYFTAKKIADKSAKHLEVALQSLAGHVADKEWREVFLLTASILKNADALLMMMKAQIDGLISLDEELQEFLTWLSRKTKSVESTFSPAIVRAHCSHLVTGRPLARFLVRALADDPASTFARTHAFDTSSDVNATRIKFISSDFSQVIANTNNIFAAIEMARDFAIVLLDNISSPNIISNANPISTTIQRVMDKAILLASDPALERSLQEIKNQLPDTTRDLAFTQWWQDYGYIWAEKLRDVQIQSLNLVSSYQFSKLQISLLDQYYEANFLLVECLNSDCYFSRTVRDEIEATLLLSIKDIEQYKNSVEGG